MLHDFLRDHRQNLIARAAAKVAGRAAPRARTPEEPLHGVPVFLTQLGEALKIEATGATPFPTRNISASATLHGNEMLRLGYTVNQLVHGYGDVCQAITQLAQEKNFTISSREFQGLNRALDDAIAQAVTEYARQREEDMAAAQTGREALAFEQRNLLCSATLAWQMLTRGTVGLKGSTAGVLTRSLEKLRQLDNRLDDRPPIADASLVTS